MADNAHPVDPSAALIAESVAHKITVSGRGGYVGAYVKCLCGWNFSSRYDTRVDRKAEEHLRLNDGEASS